jgi:hypothetical protein
MKWERLVETKMKNNGFPLHPFSTIDSIHRLTGSFFLFILFFILTQKQDFI